METNKLIRLLESKNTELHLAIETRKETKGCLVKEHNKLLMLDKLKTLVILIGQESQEKVLGYIEDTVTMALVSVFGDEYKFKIEMTNKRDQSEANFYIEHKGNLLEPRQDLVGGGVIDTCSFALRLVIWSLTNSNDSKVFFLDEPMKNLSAEYAPKASEMVKQFSSMLDVQIIMVTHNAHFISVSDNIIEIN